MRSLLTLRIISLRWNALQNKISYQKRRGECLSSISLFFLDILLNNCYDTYDKQYVMGSIDEIDEEFMSWIFEAAALSNNKW